MQRRRAVLFASVAATFSIVAVMAVGAIRSVEPPPGTPVAFPAESLDKQMVTVPDVVGLRVTRAEAMLRSAGLKLENNAELDCNPFSVKVKGKNGRNKDVDIQVDVKPKDRGEPHVVFCTVSRPMLVKSQFPAAGSEVDEGIVVDLTFGPRMRSGVRIRVGDMTEMDD